MAHHPLTDPYELPVSPLVLAYVGALTVLLVALASPRAAGRGGGAASVRPVTSWAGEVGGGMRVSRGLGVLVLILAVIAGRAGVDDELENLAPALVVGAGWPLLVLGSVLAGPMWRWVDPWDTLARLLAPSRAETTAPASVWPAVLVVLPWLWYLSAYPDTLDPGAVGLALALYTLVTLAGCIALGRVRWLATAEPVGILLGWLSLVPTRRLGSWTPPAGADALLGVVAGGLLFGPLRHSEVWGGLNTSPNAEMFAALGVIGSGVGVAAVLVLLGRMTTRDGDRADVARAAVPALAGIAVAVAMERNRLTTSLQLLPGLVGDPLGKGWDWWGPAVDGLDPAPFGVGGLITIQLGLVLLGGLGGVIAAGRRTPRSARLPVAVSVAILVDAAVLAVATH